MIDPVSVATAVATSPLISFTWEAIKSGVVYDAIKKVSEKTLNKLLGHREQNNLNAFSEVLETALDLSPALKKELEQYMTAGNSITQVGNSNQAINTQSMNHSGSGDNVGGNKEVTYIIQSKEDTPKY